jgi:hypothetical protein
MSIELMGPRRHAILIKAAEACVDGMNDGAAPNAALRKVAQEFDLNAKEVALVSHAVNNSRTLSHLANSEAEAKADPFPLTNADEVTQELFPEPDAENKKPANGTKPGEHPEVESPNKLPGAKKTAAESEGKVDPEDIEASYKEAGDFRGARSDADAEAEDAELFKTAREAFGVDPLAMRHGRLKVACDIDGLRVSADFGMEASRIREALDSRLHGVDCSRLADNPFIKLQNLKSAAEAARTKFSEHRDAAFVKLARIVESFARIDSPAFSRVETLAKRAGVDPATLDVIWVTGGLENRGHHRATPAMKIASDVIATCTPREKEIVDSVSTLETLWKHASHCLAAKNEVDRRLAEAGPWIAKIAEDAGGYVRDVTDLATSLPETAMGGKLDEVVGGALNNRSGGDKPDYGVPAKSPLSSGGQQRVKNTSAAISLASLMEDPYIAQRPIPETVRAFNAVMTTNPDADASMVRRLVKDQLASGGDLDTDVLMRLQKHQAKG